MEPTYAETRPTIDDWIGETLLQPFGNDVGIDGKTDHGEMSNYGYPLWTVDVVQEINNQNVNEK